MNDLLEAYSGDRATAYDDRRSKSKRWRAEIKAMEMMLRQIQATHVLDCPFGTGRWLPQYAESNMRVTGIDLSGGMLEQARSKLDAFPEKAAHNVTLIEQSIFDLEPTQYQGDVDLVVCVRFLNWISFEDVTKVAKVLSSIGSKQMIIGVSVIPANASFLRRTIYMASLWLNNARRDEGKPPQFVHDEKEVLQLFSGFGWEVAEKSLITRRRARINNFYRLTRN
jgi:SAM-dependent methyltransferase